MQYIIGGLVGIVLMSLVLFLSAKLSPIRIRNPTEVEEALVEHWQRWDANEAARNVHLARIAEVVTTWEQRYTRRKGKAIKEEATP